MHHMINNNTDGFAVKNSKSNSTKRIAQVKKPDKLFGKRVKLGMKYGKAVHGVINAVLPAALYKQVMQTAKDEGINVSDLVRRGVMREVGAIRFSRSLGLNPATYGAGAIAMPAAPVAKKDNSKAIKAIKRALVSIAKS